MSECMQVLSDLSCSRSIERVNDSNELLKLSSIMAELESPPSSVVVGMELLIFL